MKTLEGEIVVSVTPDNMVQIAVISTEDDGFSFDIDVSAAKHLGKSLLEACKVINAGKN